MVARKNNQISKSIKVVAAQDVFDKLDDWSNQEDRGVGKMAGKLLEKAIKEAEESGEYTPSLMKDGKQKEMDSTYRLAISYVKALAEGGSLNILDIQKLANDLGVSSDRLAQLINNGGKHHAKNNH